MDSGLSQSVVCKIHQDRQGFMWFGTWDGLNRYNGYDFRVYRYKPDDPSSISDSRAEEFCQTSDGTIWVGTISGLNRFDPHTETFQRHLLELNASQTLGNNIVTGIAEASAGKLWVSTPGRGFYLYDPEEGALQHFLHDPRDSNSLSDNRIRAIVKSAEGTLWLATDYGLNRFDPERGEFRRYLFHPEDEDSLANRTQALLVEEDTLWVGTKAGLRRLDPVSAETVNYEHDPDDPSSLSNDFVSSIIRDRDGNLWVGTFGGGIDVLLPSASGFEHYQADPTDPSSLSHDFVSDLFEDDSGVMWVGTHGGGLNKVVRPAPFFETVGENPASRFSLSSPNVRSILEDRSGTVWVGTDKGLNRIDSNGTRVFRDQPSGPHRLEADAVHALLEEGSGLLWIATQAGLKRFDPQLEVFKTFPFESRLIGIRCLYLDNSGDLWLGTSNHGVLRLTAGSDLLKRFPIDGLRMEPGYAINIMRNDALNTSVLWVGTDGHGLFRVDYSSGAVQNYRHVLGESDSLSHDNISALQFDALGKLWVGTYGGGLNRLDTRSGRVTRFDQKDGLPNLLIYGIVEDDARRLWVSTNQGIVYFDPRQPIFNTLDVDDGLPSNEFNVGAYAKGSHGSLYFGSIGGLTAIFPGLMRRDDYAPPVVFTSWRVNGGPSSLGTDSGLTLPFNSGVLSLEFASLDFRLPKKNRYAYRLEGLSDGWIDLGSKRELSFPNLSPGTYSLEVRGSNSSGVWSDRTAKLQVQVLAPWWAWWWVRLIGSVSAAGTVWLLYRLSKRRAERHELAMEGEAEKRKQLQDALLRQIAADGEEGEEEKAVPWWLRQARDRLRKEFRQAPTVKELADAAGVHPDYLGRCFRQSFGVRIGEYVDQLRLEWAGEQLVGTSNKIVEIALEAGFADQSHLTRRFRKHFGITPAQYRRFSQRENSPKSQASP